MPSEWRGGPGRTNAAMRKRIAFLAWSFAVAGLGCGKPAPSPQAPAAPPVPHVARVDHPRGSHRALVGTNGPIPARPEAKALVPREMAEADPVVWRFEPPFYGVLFDDSFRLSFRASERQTVSGKVEQSSGPAECWVDLRRDFANAVAATVLCSGARADASGDIFAPVYLVATTEGLAWVDHMPADFVELDEVLHSPPAIPISRAAYRRTEARPEETTLEWIGQPMGGSGYCVERREPSEDGDERDRLCFDEHRGLHSRTFVSATKTARLTFRARYVSHSDSE